MAAVRRHESARLFNGDDKQPQYQAIIQRERPPAPKSQNKFKRIEGAGSFPGKLKARSFSFLTIEILLRDEGREPSTDDELGALRESASSPSQETCASKCVRGSVSLCLHLFISHVWLNSKST